MTRSGLWRRAGTSTLIPTSTPPPSHRPEEEGEGRGDAHSTKGQSEGGEAEMQGKVHIKLTLIYIDFLFNLNDDC